MMLLSFGFLFWLFLHSPLFLTSFHDIVIFPVFYYPEYKTMACVELPSSPVQRYENMRGIYVM